MSLKCEMKCIEKKTHLIQIRCSNLKLGTNRIKNNINIILSINHRIFDICIKINCD